jgi:hypothetical protein
MQTPGMVVPNSSLACLTSSHVVLGNSSWE